jgi:hypothetical protein
LSSYEEKSDANAKLYSPLENITVVAVRMSFREKLIFQSNIPKKQMLWCKDLQPCDKLDYRAYTWERTCKMKNR